MNNQQWFHSTLYLQRPIQSKPDHIISTEYGGDNFEVLLVIFSYIKPIILYNLSINI